MRSQGMKRFPTFNTTLGYRRLPHRLSAGKHSLNAVVTLNGGRRRRSHRHPFRPLCSHLPRTEPAILQLFKRGFSEENGANYTRRKCPAALCKPILYISITQGEPGTEPNGVAIKIRRKAMTFDGVGLYRGKYRRGLRGALYCANAGRTHCICTNVPSVHSWPLAS